MTAAVVEPVGLNIQLRSQKMENETLIEGVVCETDTNHGVQWNPPMWEKPMKKAVQFLANQEYTRINVRPHLHKTNCYNHFSPK